MTTPTRTHFPFTLSDITGYMIRRQDGTVVKFHLNATPPASKMKSLVPSGPTWQSPYVGYQKLAVVQHVSMSKWCKHDPVGLPLFSGPDFNVWIADSSGAKAYRDKFDLVVDGGNVLIDNTQLLTGDAAFVRALTPQVVNKTARVLKINWADRGAPELLPTFWPQLVETITTQGAKRVLVCCQGGHGRSGTSAVALMMCLSDYDPLDAITHLRAVHCPRAIESIVQHDYLDSIAEMLGRTTNAKESEKVEDFRKRFLSLTCATSAPYRARLEAANKVADEVSKEDDSYGY